MSTIQMRPSPGNTPEPGSLWASPQRDIAHSFPDYVRKALDILTKQLAGGHGKTDTQMQELVAYARVLADFVSGTMETRYTNLEQLVQASGLIDAPTLVQERFGAIFFRVIAGAYFTAVRHAYKPGAAPLGINELMNAVDGMKRHE